MTLAAAGCAASGSAASMHAARCPEWRRLLEGECATSPQLWRYASDPREGDCLRLLPGLPRRRALFLGNALAILPIILADVFESVVIADSDSRRLALAGQRRDEDGRGNVACVLTPEADDVSAPPGQFDLVVLGEARPDATSWLPFRDADAPRRLRSAIGPEGCLMYGVRFPRFPAGANAMLEARRRRTPLFYPAHARLLGAAGFTEVRGYGRWPDARPYEAYVPLDDAAVAAYWLSQGARPRGIRRRAVRAVKGALGRLGAWHYLFNNLLVIARRG